MKLPCMSYPGSESSLFVCNIIALGLMVIATTRSRLYYALRPYRPKAFSRVRDRRLREHPAKRGFE
jgi:hypothetical protein